jgi:hypothetical protein
VELSLTLMCWPLVNQGFNSMIVSSDLRVRVRVERNGQGEQAAPYRSEVDPIESGGGDEPCGSRQTPTRFSADVPPR